MPPRVATHALCAWLALGGAACVSNVPTARPATHSSTKVQDPAEVAAAPLRQAMRQLRSELARAGLAPDPQAFAGFLPSGEHATFLVHVDAGECRALVALATQGVGDVDAALYAPDGEVVALDAEPDPTPMLQVCAGTRPRDLYYVIQLYDGDGSFVVLPFSGTRTSLAAASRALHRSTPIADLSHTRAGAEDPLASLREGLRKRGFVPQGDPITFAIVQGERVRTALPALPASCYAVAAFGGDGVRELGLRVRDARGEELSVGEGVGSHTALQLCARRDEQYVIETEARSGTGRVMLLVFRADVVVAGGDAGLWLGQRQGANAP